MDSLSICSTNGSFRRTAYLMMLERQLSKYKFFTKIGAYSIEPESRGSVIESLEYTVALLNQEMSLVSVFPQGQLLPWYTRPLGYKRGVEWILRKYGNPVTVLPLAIRAEFLGEQRPSVFFLFGEVQFIMAWRHFMGWIGSKIWKLPCWMI